VSADLDGWREIVAYLRGASERERERLLDDLEAEEVGEGVSALDMLVYDWASWARPEQLEPEAGVEWRWLVHRAGRGGGKTRGGAEMVRSWASDPDSCGGSIALVAPTYADIRITMVEGESGILACSPPWDFPEWQPGFGHAGRLVWPSGVEALCFSAEKPDRIRGPQFGRAWCDEWAAYGERGMDVFDLLNPALRLGPRPAALWTSTPKPTALALKFDDDAALVEREIAEGKRPPHKRTTIQRVWSTWANADNLPASTVAELASRYAGTTQGRQELDAMLLRDDPGALWSYSLIHAHRVTPDEVPDLVAIAVACDNAKEARDGVLEAVSLSDRNRAKGPADTAIIVVGLDERGHFYVLSDWTRHAKPEVWGEALIDAFLRGHDGQRANTVVIERNGGGELIERNVSIILRDRGIPRALVPTVYVQAKDGKEARAEPVRTLYGQGRVHHVYVPSDVPGYLQPLEDLEFQMVNFKRGPTGWKKDRVDALVYAITHLIERPTVDRSRAAGRRAAGYVR
jgi:phage terminase large subunit-like protein